MNNKPPRRKFHPIYLCLVLPFVAIFWTPFFDRTDPALLGIPFFYWYQMFWTLFVGLMILPVYLYENRAGK